MRTHIEIFRGILDDIKEFKFTTEKDLLRYEINEVIGDPHNDPLDWWNTACYDSGEPENAVLPMECFYDLFPLDGEYVFDSFSLDDLYFSGSNGTYCSYSDIDDTTCSPYDTEALIDYIIDNNEDFDNSELRFLLDLLRNKC